MAIRRRLAVAAGLFFASMTIALAGGIRLPEGPGVKLIYANCQTCHDLQYLVDSKGLLPAQWQSLMTSMQDYGLEVSKQEKAQIMKYLTTYLGPNPPPSTKTEKKPAKVDGATVFAESCASCHGNKGRGQPGYFPPLANNPDLLKDRLFPVFVVLHGLSGPIQVNGQSYNGSMPAVDHLSNNEIAAVVNYIRDAWAGRTTKIKAITPELVAKSRKRSMSPADVQSYRASIQ